MTEQDIATKPEPLLARPRNRDNWIKLWKRPSEEVLFKGDTTFPDIHQRQRHLVGVAVDAAIVLHIYENLKDGKTIDSKELNRFFPGTDFRPGEIDTLQLSDHEKTMPQADREKRNDARMKLLVEMSKEGRILHRYTLVPRQAFDTRKAKAQAYDEQIENDKAAHTRWDGRPEDLRLVALHNGFPDFITKIKDPGAKTRESTEGKMSDRVKEMDMMPDLNRVALLPHSPEHRKDFNKILKLRFPPKQVTMDAEEFNAVRKDSFPDAPKATGPVEVLIPQVFSEPTQVFKHGYFSQMTFVAIDRAKGEKEGDITATTKGNWAAVGEIKFAPYRSEYAEERTGIFKPVIKDLWEPSLYTRQGTKERREKLAGVYERAKKAYERSVTPEQAKERPFPRPVSSSGVNHSDAYKTFRQSLLMFQQNLPASIGQSDEVNSLVSALIDAVEDPYLYVDEGVGRRRATLAQKYAKVHASYTGKLSDAERTQLDLQLPRFIEDKGGRLDQPQSYVDLRESIINLQHQVNIGAITAENDAWRREFIETALLQKMFNESGSRVIEDKEPRLKGLGKEAQRSMEVDLARFDNVTDAILRDVAKGVGIRGDRHNVIYPHALDFDRIKADVIQRYSQAHWRKPVKERG